MTKKIENRDEGTKSLAKFDTYSRSKWGLHGTRRALSGTS